MIEKFKLAKEISYRGITGTIYLISTVNSIIVDSEILKQIFVCFSDILFSKSGLLPHWSCTLLLTYHMDMLKRNTSTGTNLVGVFGSGWALGSCVERMPAWEAGQASQGGRFWAFSTLKILSSIALVLPPSSFFPLTEWCVICLLSFSKSCFAALFHEKEFAQHICVHFISVIFSNALG